MHVSGSGLVCAVGLETRAACAAIRAGLSGLVELPYVDGAGEVVIGGVVPGLDWELGVEERLVELLAPAIREALSGLRADEIERTPLLLGLAEPARPGGGGVLAGRILERLQQRLGLRFLEALSRVLPVGRTAGLEALGQARELLRTRGVEACLVCGVDSYLNARSLHWLDRAWRLKSPRNSDGVIPGEAAAAVLLRGAAIGPRAQHCEVSGLGFAREEATILSEEPPFRGLGLAAASRSALSEAGLQLHQIGFRVADLTGEAYGFKEQALVIGRVLRVRRENGLPIWHPSQCIGDTGAASGIVQVILVAVSQQRGYAPGDVALCFSSGDFGERAAAVICAAPASR